MSLNALAKALKALSDVVSSMSEDEVEALLDGRLEISWKVKAAKKAGAASTHDAETMAHFQATARQLETLPNREAGLELLSSAFRNKRELRQFCKYLDLPSTRRDSRPQIESAIVEATIGYRLRSAAIRNTPV